MSVITDALFKHPVVAGLLWLLVAMGFALVIGRALDDSFDLDVDDEDEN